MARKDRIEMSPRDLKRLKAVQEAIGRHVSQKEAAEMIGVSERQIRRLIRSVRDKGEAGIGRPSKRRVSEEVKDKLIEIYQA